MPILTAVLYTNNDALRLGRSLETLHPCDRILVVDDNSQDETIRIAREYGASVAGSRIELLTSLNDSDWILQLNPSESLTEALSASLYELKVGGASHQCFSIRLREETPSGWIQHRLPETRLIPAAWHSQGEELARNNPASVLEGELLRFAFP